MFVEYDARCPYLDVPGEHHGPFYFHDVSGVRPHPSNSPTGNRLRPGSCVSECVYFLTIARRGLR